MEVAAARSVELQVRVPRWAAANGGNVTVACGGVVAHQQMAMPPGMHGLPLRAGVCTVVLLLPMQLRVERRPPYRLSANVTVDTNTATIHRGPLLFSMPRGFHVDLGTPYGADQERARNHVLLGQGI